MSFFSSLNPTPTLPPYNGPYKVGTQDVEIPVEELPSPVPCPDDSIKTITFRLFYPCTGKGFSWKKSAHWLAEPQEVYLKAYLRFLGSSPRLATVLSYLPILRPLLSTIIPAQRNSKILPPDEGKRWPVMIFSHGLGGTKNAYSALCGSLASYGIVVAAMEHRDGSAPISLSCKPLKTRQEPVEYLYIPHNPPKEKLPEVEDKRIHQLKIRCWELGLLHEALIKLDTGSIKFDDASRFFNLNAMLTSEMKNLYPFESKLDVHTPGKIIFAGHSYGASTVVEFLKSIHYPADSTTPSDYTPLFSPSPTSAICSQITTSTPTILLDLWAIPLAIQRLDWLNSKPLPVYTSNNTSATPPLAVLSEAFYKWKGNLSLVLQTIAPPSSSSNDKEPLIFYPVSSAHLSQSDFGLLYPYLTKRFMRAMHPQKTLTLNLRAALEYLRRNGVSVSNTSDIDMGIVPAQTTMNGTVEKEKIGLVQDNQILSTEAGTIGGWVAVHVDSSGREEEKEANGTAVLPGKDGGLSNGSIKTNGYVTAVVKGEIMKVEA